MPEDVSKHFLFPNFKAPVPGTLREVLDNDTTRSDNFFLGGLRVKTFEYGGVSMMLIIGMEVAQDYNIFNYTPPRPQKDTKSQ